MAFFSFHHLAVGTDPCGGGLAARSAGMEDGSIFLRHGGRRGLLRSLLVEKAPVEGLFRSWRLSLQTIQDFLVLEHLGTLRHRALLDNVVDPIQDRIGGKLSLREPEEGFYLLGKPFHRSGQRWALLVQIFLLPCLLYTSDAADERSSVDLGGRRIIK